MAAHSVLFGAARPGQPASVGRERPPILAIAAWAIVILLVGCAIALPDPFDVALGAVGGVAAVLALIQPLVALPLLLLAVPFGGLARGSSGDSSTDLSFGAAEILVALLGAVWLARGVRRRALYVHGGAVVVATLAMVSLAAFSIAYAEDRPSAIKESLKWLELLLALVVVVDLASEPGPARWVIGAMFVAGAAEAAYGAIQFLTGSGPGAFELSGALRAFGHFDQPNPFAGYLTTILPLAVCMALCRANPAAFRWLSAASAGLLLVGIGLSQSRGAWLGGGVAGLTLLLAWNRGTRRLLIPGALAGGGALALAVSGLLPASILDRLSQTVQYFGVFDVRTVDVTSDNWAVVERMAHWQAGWYMFLDHPWLGVGAGNYAQAYPLYFVGMWREALGHAHNYYLNMLAELGVIGGGLLLLLLGLAFRQLGGALVNSESRVGPRPKTLSQRTSGSRDPLRNLSQEARPTATRAQSGLSAELLGSFWRAVLAGVFGGLVVFCVHNMFDSLFVHSVNIQVGVLLGLGLLAANRLSQPASPIAVQ